MKEVSRVITSWASGVVTTVESDALPGEASPRGWNAVLTSAGGQDAVPEKRRGLKTRNRTAVTGSPVINGIVEFKGATTNFGLLTSSTGRIDWLKADDSLQNLVTGLSGTDAPDFAQAKKILAIVNGSYRKKVVNISGTPTVQDLGIARPAAPTLAEQGVGVMSGTYEFEVSLYNENTGHESSASDVATITVTTKTVRVTRPTVSDTQVTHWRPLIRKTSLASLFKTLTSATGYVVGKGIPIATTYVDVNPSDADLNNLLLFSPSQVENEPPPSGVKFVEYHGDRLFVADDENVYFSKAGYPEAFNPTSDYEPANPSDGQSVRGLLSTAGRLFILKEHSIIEIAGDDPKTWTKRTVYTGVGCMSHRSIVVDPNGVSYWWSETGPVAFTADGPPIPIGRELIADTISEDVLNPSLYKNVCAALQSKNELIVFAVAQRNQEGEPSSTRNNIILPWNWRLKRWVSDLWNPLDVASLGTITDANGVQWVHVGGYHGQAFKLWDADNDGIAGGTTKGTVTAATSTTLTDSTATFDTTGAGLTGRYVYVIDPLKNVQRRRIGSNTATQLTLDSGLSWSVTPNTNYTYVVGGIDWEWDTYDCTFKESLGERAAFLKKRLAFAYVEMKTPTANTNVDILVFKDYGLNAVKTMSIEVNPGGATWGAGGTGVWDESRWATESPQPFRKRLGLVARAIRLRFRNINPDEPILLLKAGVIGEVLNDNQL